MKEKVGMRRSKDTTYPHGIHTHTQHTHTHTQKPIVEVNLNEISNQRKKMYGKRIETDNTERGTECIYTLASPK